jgi:hypothetical protein
LSNNNNNNNKVSNINKAPVTGRTTREVNVVGSKILGTIHTGTTKYEATSTRSNISIAHERISKSLISKYDATENHVSTGIPPIKVLKSCESTQTGSKILITHENLTHFHMPKVIKNIDRDKPHSDRATTSIGTNKGTIKYDTTAITKYDTISTQPNIPITPISTDNPI